MKTAVCCVLVDFFTGDGAGKVQMLNNDNR